MGGTQSDSRSDSRLKRQFKCRECLQEFRRKWNLRRHCRSQHGYDPQPDSRLRPFKFLNSPGLPEALERFVKNMGFYFDVRRMGTSRVGGRDYERAIKSAETLLDYVNENYVLINKREIFGVLGFLCDKCFAFQFRYIRDIGLERTPKDVHTCDALKFEEVNQVRTDEQYRYTQFYYAINCLVYLTNTLFPRGKNLSVYSYPQTAKPIYLHGPTLEVNSMDSKHCAFEAISRKSVMLNEEGLRNFLGLTLGTFAFLSVNSGPFSGQYLICVTGKQS
jgi:hypothetical protein